MFLIPAVLVSMGLFGYRPVDTEAEVCVGFSVMEPISQEWYLFCSDPCDKGCHIQTRTIGSNKYQKCDCSNLTISNPCCQLVLVSSGGGAWTPSSAGDCTHIGDPPGALCDIGAECEVFIFEEDGYADAHCD